MAIDRAVVALSISGLQKISAEKDFRPDVNG